MLVFGKFPIHTKCRNSGGNLWLFFVRGLNTSTVDHLEAAAGADAFLWIFWNF